MNASLLAAARSQGSRLFNPKLTPPRQAWVETFIGKEKQLLDIIELNPKIFGAFPRIDYIGEVLKWQKSYRDINYISMPTRNELPGGTKKPWPQKGTGRARHGSVNSPIFLKGGWARGPRGPTTSFTLRPHFHLVNCMRHILSIKLAQNDLKVVDTLADHDYEDLTDLEDRFGQRRWGPSVLIVDKMAFPQTLVDATENINHVNLMSHVSLNPLSICKHETLVITLDAIREIEDRLIYHLVRVDLINTHQHYKE